MGGVGGGEGRRGGARMNVGYESDALWVVWGGLVEVCFGGWIRGGCERAVRREGVEKGCV